jgi:sugar phosphate permease
MRQFYMSLTEEPAAFIAIYASLAVKLTGITFSLFGLILIKDNYIRENLHSPETSAKSLIEVLSLIGNLATVPNGLFFGWLSDRFKAWKLLLLNLLVFSGFLALFIVFIESNHVAFQVGYVGVHILNQNIYMLSLIILGRVAKPDSRGTLYGAFGLVGSIGVLLINKLGSTLYKSSHSWPFLIAAAVYAGFLVLVVALGACRKLKV